MPSFHKAFREAGIVLNSIAQGAMEDRVRLFWMATKEKDTF
jgi:hypothetical protein